MQIPSMDHIKYTNSNFINFIEEYCVALPKTFGRSIQHFKQIDEKNAVPCSAESKDWKHTALKIFVIASLLIPLIPLTFLAIRFLHRKITPLDLQPPAYENSKNHPYLKEALEIRKIRVDGPEKNEAQKKIPFHFRTDLPADLIINTLIPGEENKNALGFFGNPKLKHLNFLSPELEQKKRQLLQEDFNSFNCVQGVEGLKGGIRNLLNIMLEGVIRTPYAAALIAGNAEYCAGPHGPFYVILDKVGMTTPEENQIAYLVPAELHREFLEKALSIAVDRGYITEDEKQRSLSKVITYDEFIALPSKERHSEKALKRWLENR